MTYTKTNSKWLEIGDYFNLPESLMNRVRIRKIVCSVCHNDKFISVEK